MSHKNIYSTRQLYFSFDECIGMILIWQCLDALSMQNPHSGRQKKSQLRTKHVSLSARWAVRLKWIHQECHSVGLSLGGQMVHPSQHQSISSQCNNLPNLILPQLSQLPLPKMFLKSVPLFHLLAQELALNYLTTAIISQLMTLPIKIPCSIASRIIFLKYKSDLVTYLQ